MSHYCNVGVKIKDVNCLVDALMAMGFTEDQIDIDLDEPMPLRGYKGDERPQKAHIRIKGAGWPGKNAVGQASNDLGWEISEEEMIFHVSRFDTTKYGTQWQARLMHSYSRNVVEQTAVSLGWTQQSVEEQNNQVVYQYII
jgi:hypothetical protein